MSKNSNPMKVVTGVNTRWSYVNAWEPKSINGGTPKFSVILVQHGHLVGREQLLGHQRRGNFHAVLPEGHVLRLQRILRILVDLAQAQYAFDLNGIVRQKLAIGRQVIAGNRNDRLQLGRLHAFLLAIAADDGFGRDRAGILGKFVPACLRAGHVQIGGDFQYLVRNGLGEHALQAGQQILSIGEEGLSFFGLDSGSFTRETKSAREWLQGVLAVWSDGKKETNEIVKEWTDSFKELTASTRSELEEMRETAQTAGYTSVADQLSGDIDKLDAMDAEISRLLKKRQNGYFSDKDKIRLQELIDAREAIEVKYHLSAADTDGFEQIGQKLQAEIARAQAAGKPDADVAVYENAVKAAAEGMGAINTQLAEQYDKSFHPPPALATVSANLPMPVDTVPTPLTIFENTRIAGPAAAAMAANLIIMSR